MGAVVGFGFRPCPAPIMLFAYLRPETRAVWWLCLILSAAVFGILYLFETVLGVPLFEGAGDPDDRGLADGGGLAEELGEGISMSRNLS